MNCIIIHGANGSPKEHWLPWLQKQLEPYGPAIAPQFPIGKQQSLRNWLEAVRKAKIDKNTILIGHSIGCAFILDLLEKHPARAAFLVGGFTGKLGISYDSANKSFAEREFDWEKIRRHCGTFLVYHSDNDPYVPFEQGREFAQHLGVPLRLVSHAGHFRSQDGYATFPALFVDIMSIVKNNKAYKRAILRQ